MDAQLIYEAYNPNAKPLLRRYELRPVGDSWVIINHAKRAPYNIVARFDADEKEAAQSRFKDLSEPLSGPAISQGFERLKQELQKEHLQSGIV